jgi:hypothetical protein
MVDYQISTGANAWVALDRAVAIQIESGIPLAAGEAKWVAV